MEVIGYEMREGFVPQRGVKTDASVIGQRLEYLRKHFKGELQPRDVVDDARNPNSPIHSYFEWDDGLAAEQYRLSQARGLIRSVVAIYREPEKQKQPIRIAAFTRVPETTVPHYRATHHALEQKATRALILQQAWRDLQAWRRRYAHLKEFADLVKVVEQLEGSIGKAS